ncbi:MAG: hypothetical protein HFJ08_16230 [Lachnospiraceae bacterium]|jgi:hypothetical protein|nr:hypothetical protein [Lachnospiraceae bacterium]MCX4374972.1 hypothetical protein [Lachnospiraceae bacterium]
MNTIKPDKIDLLRLKDIVAQLADIIYLLCGAKEQNVRMILANFTNLSDDELSYLNLSYPKDAKE